MLRKKCIRQFVLNAVRNAMFHSNLIRVGQFTAGNAGPRKDHNEDDAKLLMLNHFVYSIFFCLIVFFSVIWVF